jgi:hypothetical protein
MKISLYDPQHIKKVQKILGSGVVMDIKFDAYEVTNTHSLRLI